MHKYELKFEEPKYETKNLFYIKIYVQREEKISCQLLAITSHLQLHCFILDMTGL